MWDGLGFITPKQPRATVLELQQYKTHPNSKEKLPKYIIEQ